MKICSCGFTEFQVKVETLITQDNIWQTIVKICCVKCDAVYFPNEVEELPDTEN